MGDGCTASNFFYNWGVLSRDINATLSSPHFVEDSIYPQSDINPTVVLTIKSEESFGYLGKRFVFPAAKINALKAKVAHESEVHNPTRTEVICAKGSTHLCHMMHLEILYLDFLCKQPMKGTSVVQNCLIALPLYKTDFGWGRPARVSMATGHFSKLFFLMDNQSEGGVEAIVMLDEQDMSIFDRDPELLEFAIPAPNL
uniref:BAHD acyltransferase At5g47980-like n=1 Tax=Nicotiana tabacum TaxID=4097 RepID=A0A1S3X7I3_TOBAC|nr:PREDICTED: uncharacterized protein LOC107762156 [Nicotiana tabacum]